MYKCKYCNKEFNSPQKLGGHIMNCILNPNNLQNLNCKYCGKECKNNNSLINHERLCKLNPNHSISNFVNYNKNSNVEHSNQYIKAKQLGLPKPEVSEESHVKRSISSSKHKHSNETKQKISNIRKKYLEEHPDKIPFKLNHSSKQSYPEQYFEELFINENIPLKYHLQVGRYELDFYSKDLMKYIEIDGEQHYSDYMINHDKERDEYLKQLGWEGLRIRWSEYQKMTNIEKQNKIIEIKLFLQK